MGHKITQLEPIDGVCAETFPAFTIFLATHLGVPVSTTHVITGAISRVGSELRFSSFRWGVTICIVGRGLHSFGRPLLGRLIYLLCGIVGLNSKRILWPDSDEDVHDLQPDQAVKRRDRVS
jgi:hypothetical protein